MERKRKSSIIWAYVGKTTRTNAKKFTVQPSASILSACRKKKSRCSASRTPGDPEAWNGPLRKVPGRYGDISEPPW